MVIAEADVHGELGVHALDGRVENGRQFLAVLVNLAESRFIDLNEIGTGRRQRLKLFVDDSDKIPGEFLLIPVACGDNCPRGKGRRTGACHLRWFRGVLLQVCELLYDPQPSGRADLAHDLVDLARMIARTRQGLLRRLHPDSLDPPEIGPIEGAEAAHLAIGDHVHSGALLVENRDVHRRIQRFGHVPGSHLSRLRFLTHEIPPAHLRMAPHNRGGKNRQRSFHRRPLDIGAVFSAHCFAWT